MYCSKKYASDISVEVYYTKVKESFEFNFEVTHMTSRRACLALHHFHDVVQVPPHRVEEDLAHDAVAQHLREVDRQATSYMPGVRRVPV
jgi:hypothetical protein